MKKTGVIVIVLITLLIIVGIALVSIIIIKNDETKRIEDEGTLENVDKNPEYWNVQIVQDETDFYTVASCVSKFLNLWFTKDTDQLLQVLDEEYKVQNSITKDNIYEIIGDCSSMLNFRPKKMYSENLDVGIERFYVYGTIRPELMEGRGEETDYYAEVILNYNNNTFTLTPSTAENFPDVE